MSSSKSRAPTLLGKPSAQGLSRMNRNHLKRNPHTHTHKSQSHNQDLNLQHEEPAPKPYLNNALPPHPRPETPKVCVFRINTPSGLARLSTRKLRGVGLGSLRGFWKDYAGIAAALLKRKMTPNNSSKDSQKQKQIPLCNIPGDCQSPVLGPYLRFRVSFELQPNSKPKLLWELRHETLLLKRSPNPHIE